MSSQSLLTINIKKLWMPIAGILLSLTVALAPMASAARLELPTAPVALRATSATQPVCTQTPCMTALAMQWEANPTAEQVTSYVVFRDNVQVATVAASSAPSYTTTVLSGNTYAFYVKAVNSRGTGPSSNTIFMFANNQPTQGVPPAPQNFRLSAALPALCSPAPPCTNSNAKYTVAWDPVISNPAVTDYNIYINGVDSIGQIASLPTNTSVFVPAGATWSFNAQAAVNFTRGPPSLPLSITAPVAPTTPTNLQFSSRPHTTCPIQGPCFADFTISWNAAPTNQQIMYYEVFLNGSLVATVPTNSYAGRANLGTTGNYTVRAINGIGITAFSAPFTVTL
jgi:hypothetical protein